MARCHVLIERPPRDVWALLADGYRYADWVSGAQRITFVEPEWPQTGAHLRVRVGVGPLALEDTCTVRISEPGKRLELEARAAPFGAARIAIRLIPWGGDTLVVFDWHPLRGLGGRMHGLPIDWAVNLRNRAMLVKLARTAEAEPHRTASPAAEPAA